MAKMTYAELTQAMQHLHQRVEAMDAFLTGVVAILGRDEVLQAGRDFVEEEARAAERQLSEQVDQAVADGWLKPARVSGLKSVVIGVEEVPGRRAARMQVMPGTMRPADRGNYLGRTVGEEFVVRAPVGEVKTKVTAIYEIDEVRRAEVVAAAQAKVAEEATPATVDDPTEVAPTALTRALDTIKVAEEAKPAEAEQAVRARVLDAIEAAEASAPPRHQGCTLADPCFEDGCPTCGPRVAAEGPERGRAAKAPDSGTDLV